MSLPSACFTEVTPRKSPGLSSESAIGWVKTISVFSPTRTCVLPSTVMTSPPAAVIVPRTRVCASAAVLASASATPARKSLLRRLDAIFAHRHSRGVEHAVLLARGGEDPLARLQVGLRARHESHDRRARRHQDFLRAALVVHGDLVAAARLRD